ncbi:unnamed protein product, partial [marine sediment metagenome]
TSSNKINEYGVMNDYTYKSIDVKKYTLDSAGRKIRFCDLYYNIEKAGG